MRHGQEGLAGAGGAKAEDQFAAGQRVLVAGLSGRLGRNEAPTPNAGRGGLAAGAGLADGDADVGLSDLVAGVGAVGQHLHGPLGARSGARIARYGNAAAGGFDQDVEGVFDEGRVAAARARDGAGGCIGQGKEVGRSAQAASRTGDPARLFRAAETMRTGAIWPIRLCGASMWTDCR